MLVRPEVRLANDIAVQFHHLPVDAAAKEVAGHIKSFWPPAMRAKLFDCVDAHEAELDPLVVAAAELLR